MAQKVLAHWIVGNGPFPCNIVYCADKKVFDRVWRQLSDEPTPDRHCGKNGARAWNIPQPKDGYLPTYLICVEPGKLGLPDVASMVAHEAVHVAQWLWEQIGEDQPGHEAEAYFVQWIVRSVLEAMGV